jgi:hypothetical protein
MLLSYVHQCQARNMLFIYVRSATALSEEQKPASFIHQGFNSSRYHEKEWII